MNMFDPHIHMTSRTTSDYENMARKKRGQIYFWTENGLLSQSNTPPPRFFSRIVPTPSINNDIITNNSCRSGIGHSLWEKNG